MTQEVLEALQERPQDIFKLFQKDAESENIFNILAKSFLDPIAKDYSVLDEIYVDGLDSSQVFGQTKMVLEGVGRSLLSEKIPTLKEKYGGFEEQDEEDEDEVEEEQDEIDEGLSSEEDHSDELEERGEGDDSEAFDEEEQEEVSDLEDDEDEARTLHENEQEDGETEVGSDTENEHKKDAFGLNDGFFDIDEFNKQIVALEDDQPDAEDEEEIDYFANLSDEDEDEEEDMEYYDDFYDKPGKFKTSEVASKKAQDQESDEEDFDEGEFGEEEYDKAVGSAMLDLFADEDEVKQDEKPIENMSSFEKQQRAIQAEISKLEAELIADKKWTMKGETTAIQRPKDSLLEEQELDFDRTAKPVPIITQEVTETLEDLIRKRIKNDDFNDLPKRIITDISKFHNRQRAEVSEQKSSKSLAELYEDEFNQVDGQQEEINEEIKKQHDEITELFTNITHKLDALCSAHFVPKPHSLKTLEIKVTDASAPSISMEDAQPLHVSTETTLAPQEIYKIGDDAVRGDGVRGKSQVQLKSGLSYSKDELNREEKQRLRRANKRKKAKDFRDREEYKRQKQMQTPVNENKKQRTSEVIDTLSKAKNITVIGKKGERTDVKGKLVKSVSQQNSSNFKL
ncbi:MPP10 [[Candida] subhashii]|uniref:U3 small nucleolar ribonucleoprotein protein MPP10 n=1 Tax=[Candida] subhashii TaxID=561895 RepID=A0A8J5UX09_9ASCO|nr:MPP10 [[Candida] subhashii]KAG7663395.1 MPP10 [[Candida] subhashii]